MEPIPDKAEVVGLERKLTSTFYHWLYQVWLRVGSLTQIAKVTPLTLQGASIATTTLLAVAVTGDYRISTYGRVTTVAGVSSAFTVTVGWTDGGVVLSKTFTIANGNTTSTYDNNTWFVRADSGSNITYSVLYASNPAGVMKFKLDVIVELVN
jgi:hypothetical protein